MANENLNKWKRTFKNVGSKAGSIGIETLRNIAPGISGTVDSSVDVLRESRQFILRTKTQLQQYQRTLNTTKMGKESLHVLNSAFNDIRNGTFSLGKSSDNVYDSLDSFDDTIASIKVNDSDPASIAMVESQKNMAIIGKTITTSNVATIEGMQTMTETLSNVTLKATESAVGKLSNIALSGLNQTYFYLNGINNRLDAINENIISLLDFNRNVTYQTNQAQLEFYSETSQMMQQMGEAVSEMQDYIKSQKEIDKKKKSNDDDDFDVSRGFDFKDYAKFVKKNFDKSSLGTLSSFLSMGVSMMDMMGESPISMLLPMVAENLIPGKLKKSIKRLDSTFTSSIDTILYNIGDMANSSDFLKSTIGELFGKKRSKFGKANLSDFKKDSMGWNGIAQKTLVTVIPSYLANIEAALTKKDSRHYDMDSGMFISKSDLTEEFKNTFKSTQESSMNSFAKELDKAMENSLVTESDQQYIRELINDVTYNQLMGTGGSRKDATRTIFEAMNHKVTDTELRDVLMEWQSGMSHMISEMNNIMKVSGTKYESLFNQKGRTTDHLYNRGNVSRYHRYTTNDLGQQIDITDLDESDPLYQQYLNEQDRENQGSRFKRNITNRIRRILRLPENNRRPRGISRGIDYTANTMFDIVNGLYGYHSPNQIILNPSSSDSSAQNNADQDWINDQYSSNPRVSQNVHQSTLSHSNVRLYSNIAQMSRNLSDEANNVIKNAGLDDALSSTPAQLQADAIRVNNIISNDESTDNQSVLTKLVMSLQTNFLKPIIGGIFGKDGFFSKLLNNEHVKKIKDVLFNEESGIFKEVTIYMKDQIAAIKHVFTGKEYTDSKGVTYAEDKNSVFDYFAKGYDFVFKNTMTHIFGEDFKDNKTYKKYLEFFDFKGKRDKNRADKEKEKNEKMKSVTAQTVDAENALSDAVTYSTDKIKSTTNRMTDTLFGDFSDEEKSDEVAKSANKTFVDSIKQKLPKALAIAGVGALGGSILGIGGTGLIGSLFLPGGPIGGAIVASGIALASKSEGIKKFLFGEEDDYGKRIGGLISNKTQEFVKKNMPLIVGGGTLGLLKNIVLGSGGGVMGALIGGPLAGAAFSVGLGMLKQNDTIQNILFGKGNEDGKNTINGFSKVSDQFKKIMEKSGHFIKGGAKGIGIGVLSGTVLSQMGILGSAMTLGGPIGMGIAGLGIGIASQTNKFNEVLFGTKEFDKDGNYKGRAGDGLLTRVRNLLVVNVFEPIKDTIQERAVNLAIWAKKAIEFPFRAAFGPILNSLSNIHKNVVDAIHDTFHNVGESVTKMMKKSIDKVFAPITSVMGKVAKAVGFVAEQGIKLSLLPITAPLKFLEIITAPKRSKARWEQNKTIISNFGTLLQDAKNNTDKEYKEGKYGEGLRGKFNYLKGSIKNIKGAWDGAHFASNDELHAEGKNHLRFMDLKYEKEMLKKKKAVIDNDRKTWKAINKERSELLKSQKGATVNYTDDEFKRIQNRFVKLGINEKHISNNEDLNMFLTSRDDWKEKFMPSKGANTQEAIVSKISKFGLPDNSETKVYRQKILDKFDLVTKEITKITAQQYLASKDEFGLKEIKSMNKRFSELGITWDELGFDPTALVNKADISDEDWMRLLYDVEEKGGFTSGSFSIKDFMKWHRENKAEYKKYSDEVDAESADSASLNVLTDISESVKASAIANMNQMAMNTGAGETDIEGSTGLNIGSKEFKINKIWQKKLAADAVRKREEEENKKIRSGTKDLANEEAGRAIIDPNNATENQKSSLFEKVGGFFSDMFGSIGDFLSSKGGSLLLTTGVIGSALFGEKAVGLVKKAWDTIVPPIITQLKKAGNWIVENGPGLLDKIEEYVHNNINTVSDFILGGLGRFARIAVDVFTTIGKKAANAICKKLNIGVPFKDVETSSHQTFDSIEEANIAATNQNKNVYVDPVTEEAMILSDNEDVNSETGEIETVGTGGHLLRHSMGTYARNMIRSPLTRTVSKNVTEATLKGAGYLTGIIPGGKLIGGALKGAGSIISTTYKGGKSVAKFARNQIGKKAGEAVIEETLEKSAELSTKNAVETMAKEGGEKAVENVLKKNAKNSGKSIKGIAKTAKDDALKGIIKFLNKAKGNLLKFADDGAITKVIPKNKFVKIITSFTDLVSKKAAKLSAGALSKIVDFISKKAVKATAKTGGAALSAGISIAVFAVIDGISGALDAPYLFGVTSADVDGTMRTISALMYAILGLPVVVFFDIVLEIFALITGENPKQAFARDAYKAIKGDNGSNKLDEAAMRIQLETKKYNDAKDTNLSPEAYLEKRNAGSGLFGTIGKGFTYVTNRNKYNQKYNFSQYAVSDAEVQRALNSTNSEIDGFDYTTASDEVLVGLGPGRKMKNRLRYNKAIGYGNNILTQGDNRWGNYPIGHFPDGSVSTMATGGCGPTALAMVANEIGYGASPVSVAQYAKNNGFIKDGGATTGLFTEGASRMGLRSTALNKSSLKTSLQKGESVIVSGKSTSSNSPYTEVGHIVKASGMDSNGNVIVDDPMRGRTSVKVNDLTSGMTNGWSYTAGYGPANSLLSNPFKMKYSSNSNDTSDSVSTTNPNDLVTQFRSVKNMYNDKRTNLADNTMKRINNVLKEFKNQGYKFPNIDADRLVADGFITVNKKGGIFIHYNNNEYRLPSESQMKNGTRTSQTKARLMYRMAVDALLSIIKENYLTKLSNTYKLINNTQITNRSLGTESRLTVKIETGYKLNSDGVLYFNTPEYYVGLTINDLEDMVDLKPEILGDDRIPLFTKVYEYYTQSRRYKNNKSHKFTLDELTSIAQAAGLDDFFGTFGQVNLHEFKNGFPFFRVADDRWGDTPWKDTLLRYAGDDLASLAMIVSAFGKNIFTPKYIYDNWLTKYRGWYTNRNGLNAANVFRDGGFNVLKSTQVNGERLKISELKNISSIKSALKVRRPVYMTGLKYKGSIFGGSKPLGSFSSKDKDAYGTVVGVAANSTHMAINDPKTNAETNGIFDIDMLSDSIQNGRENVKLVKNAYSISNPDGSGIDGSVDLLSKSGGTSDYTPIDANDGLFGMIAAIFKNFGAIGNHLIDSLGGNYVSIFDEKPIEDDVADEAGFHESAFTNVDQIAASINDFANYKGALGIPIRTTLSNNVANTNAPYANRNIPTDITMDDLVKPNFGVKPGIGGGKRDIAIGYGLGSGGEYTPESIFEEMNAITHALQEQRFGGDYNAAKLAYYESKKQNEQNQQAVTDDTIGSADITGMVQTDGSMSSASSTGTSYDINPNAYKATVLSGNKKEFVDKVAPGAIKGNELYGVKASLTLAQGALESGWGRNAIGNNLFGIKAGGSWTGKIQTVPTTEYDSSGNKYTINAAFRDYNTIDESIIDHARLLTGARYKNVLAAKNYKEACYAVKEAGYATDPSYPSKLIGLIEANGFASYDNMTSASLNASNQIVGHGLGRYSRRAIGYGTSWLQIVRSVKQAIAGANVGYSQSKYITINVLGRTLSVRTDCSGFVSACCILYGSLNSVLNSTAFCNLQEMTGFTKLPWNGWDSLIPGDILAVNGHVEIYAGKDTSGNNMVYNCGSTSSIKNPGISHSSRSAYTYVWRPIESGGVASIATTETNTPSETMVNSDNASASSTSNSQLSGIWGTMANTFESIKKSASASMNSLLGYGSRQNSPASFFEKTLGGQVLSGYGNRKSILGNEYHRGIDIGAASGSPIHSPISGVVVASGNDVSGYGNYAMVQDKRGNNHLFAHMNKPVGYGVGSIISKNDILGEVGATGRATGSHLHYEIRKNGNKYSTINPMNYKYDKELGKSINISNHNMQSSDNIGYGTGNKDIPVFDPESKLNVDVNTKKVEDKLDSLITVMKAWADRDGKSPKGATNYSQVTNNNTTVYGEGKKKTSSTTKTKSPGIDLRSKTLENIHKAIASK